MAPLLQGAAVRTDRLTKDYGGRGLFELDLEVRTGEVFGFLGPNGAGKSTTIRLLMGFIRPTSGSARVFGLDCWQEAPAVKRLVGYVPGELPDWGGLRGAEIVAYQAGLQGGIEACRVADLCHRLDLDLGPRWRDYSRGNKQKLALVLALMHRPRLLILDEPTSGLDPLNQQTFFRLLEDARAAGATVFFSSHILAEVEQLCDRAAVLRAGRLVTVAEMADLRSARVRRVEIDFAGTPPVAAVRAADGVDEVSAAGNRLNCTVRGPFDPLLAAIAGHQVRAFTSREPSLEEQFFSFYRPDPAPSGPAAGAEAAR